MSYIKGRNKRIYYINSRSRLEGTDSNFLAKVEIPQNHSFDSVCVLDLLIPKSYYLIPNGQNTFVLRENGVSTTITIPVGNYSRRTFQTVVQGLLNAGTSQAWVYTVSYPNTTTQADTAKFTFSVTGNSSQPALIFTDYVYEQFGFNANSTNTFVGSALTSVNVVKFQLEDVIFLHSDICSNGLDDILQEVYVSGSSDYSNIHHDVSDVLAESKQLSTQNNNVYHFSLTNEEGQLIDLNGLNVNFTLLVYKRDDIYDLQRDDIRLKMMREK